MTYFLHKSNAAGTKLTGFDLADVFMVHIEDTYAKVHFKNNFTWEVMDREAIEVLKEIYGGRYVPRGG